jgi:hypothetical protein
MALKAQLEYEAARYASMAAETISVPGQVAAVGAVALPVLTQVGVFVALGAGYYEARQAARNEETASGFSFGLVCGMIGWKWDHVTDHFRRKYFKMNPFDDQMDAIRVNSFNQGLLAGYLAGRALPPDAQMRYLKMFRDDAGRTRPSSAEWKSHADPTDESMAAQMERARAWYVQTNYVMDLAIASRAYQQE